MTDPLERVLELVANGRLTADEAAPILEALEARGATQAGFATADEAEATDGADRGAARYARVEAESITGDLSSDQPSKRESHPGRKVLIVGRPGPTLTFRSVSGDLRVAEPRDAAPRAIDAPTAEETMEEAAVTKDDQRDPVDADAGEDKRLDILRSVERGDITVAEATDQLAQLDGVLR